MGYGAGIGWGSTALLLLGTDDNPIGNGAASADQIGWIVSMLGVGALTGTIVVRWMADHLGRKATLIYLAVPQLASWWFAFEANDVWLMMVSRLLVGFVGGGAFVTCALFVMEISEDR